MAAYFGTTIHVSKKLGNIQNLTIFLKLKSFYYKSPTLHIQIVSTIREFKTVKLSVTEALFAFCRHCG